MREIFPLEFSPRNPQVKIMNYDKLLLNKNYLSTASHKLPVVNFENETFFPFETSMKADKILKVFISPEICIILFTTSMMRDMARSAFA